MEQMKHADPAFSMPEQGKAWRSHTSGFAIVRAMYSGERNVWQFLLVVAAAW